MNSMLILLMKEGLQVLLFSFQKQSFYTGTLEVKNMRNGHSSTSPQNMDKIIPPEHDDGLARTRGANPRQQQRATTPSSPYSYTHLVTPDVTLGS